MVRQKVANTVTMHSMFGDYASDGELIYFKGEILGAGLLDYKDEKLGTYFFMRDIGNSDVYNCVKENGVYDPRHVGLKVKVTGKMKKDFIFIDSIEQLEE